MINLLEKILAAPRRSNGDKFSWLVPVAIFAVYAVSSIAKRLAESKRQEELKEKRRNFGTNSTVKPRYKPIDSASAVESRASTTRRSQQLPYAKPTAEGQRRPARRVEPRPAVQQPQRTVPRPERPEQPGPKLEVPFPAAVRTYPTAERQPRRAAPIKKPRRAKAPAPVKPAVREVRKETKAAILPGIISLDDLKEKENLRRAIVFSEILGKPLALRGFDR